MRSGGPCAVSASTYGWRTISAAGALWIFGLRLPAPALLATALAGAVHAEAESADGVAAEALVASMPCSMAWNRLRWPCQGRRTCCAGHS